MEISNEILNTGCNVKYIYNESNKLFDKIKNEIFGCYQSQKKLIFNVTEFSNLYLLENEDNPEQAINHMINVTIIMLRKVFVDSKIYYQERNITNLYGHNQMYKCIVIDWFDDNI